MTDLPTTFDLRAFFETADAEIEVMALQVQAMLKDLTYDELILVSDCDEFGRRHELMDTEGLPQPPPVAA